MAPELAVPVLDETGAGILAYGPDVAGPVPETPLSEDAEGPAVAPGTMLQAEPFHSSINVSKPSPLAATRVWPTAQAWVWDAAKVPVSWEKVLPAGLELMSTCYVPAASAGDAAISAAAASPATAGSARRTFTDSPLLALAALYVRARHQRTRTIYS